MAQTEHDDDDDDDDGVGVGVGGGIAVDTAAFASGYVAYHMSCVCEYCEQRLQLAAK